MVLTSSVLHVHECEAETFVCQDCVHHVKHPAHFSEASAMDLDCVLCKIIHTSYVTPEALTISAAALSVVILAVFVAVHVAGRETLLPSLRAPPFCC